MLRRFEVLQMALRPIRTKREHLVALTEIEALWDAPAGSPRADRLAVLVILVENYEREHFPIADPEPIEFLEHVMASRGLTRKDLEPYIGSRARVAEVLNRVRPLTLDMIRRLSVGLELPADVLIRDYKCREVA
jgi:HTH-type transcriptional regulator / antitoxin HigA